MQAWRSYPGTALIVLAALFLIIDTWGHITHAYHTTWWIDIVTHLLFGAWLALALLYPKRWQGLAAWQVLAIVMAVGIGWELLELLRDTLYAMPRGIPAGQFGMFDTVKDIIDNGLGAAAALLAYKHDGNA